MNHPLPEELFDAAQENNRAAFAAHLDACAECRTAFERLRAGAALLDEAAEDVPVDDFDWSRIDAAVNAEAERVAAGIRSGQIRAPRPWKTWAMGGLALAAAASAVVYVKHAQHEQNLEPVAHHETAPRQAPPAVTPSARFEGAMLLAAGGATQTLPGAASVRLSSGAPLLEGARVVTSSTGRAVFTVQPSVSLDVRADTDLTLATLREGAATITLAQGEVALDREGDNGSVSVRSGRWQVGLDGDAVARVDSHVLRVVVLSGRATVEADGVSRMQYTGPIVLELPDEGASRTAQGDAVDASHLDLSMLRSSGTVWALPAIDPSATLSVRGRGALPSRLEAIRVSEPVTLQARVGHSLMTLDVGTGRVLAWHASTAVATTQAPSTHPAAQRPSAIQSPEVPAPAIDGRAMAANQNRAVSRLAHCFVRCRETNQCPGVHGNVDIALDATGRPSLDSLDPSANGARTCVEGEISHMQLLPVGAPATLRIPIR